MLLAMKYIFLILLGLITVQVAPLDKRQLPSKQTTRIEKPAIKSVEAAKTAEAPKTADNTAMVNNVPQQAPATPAEAPKPAIQASGSCAEAIYRIFPAHEHNNAIKVMLQESSGNPGIHNYNPATGDDSWGCFQINLAGGMSRTRPAPSELVKADVNVQFAYNLWTRTGWCSSAGWLNTSKKVGIC